MSTFEFVRAMSITQQIADDLKEINDARLRCAPFLAVRFEPKQPLLAMMLKLDRLKKRRK